MSTKTPVQENDATYEDLAEFNAASDVSVTPAPAQSRNIFYRIVAILLALAPVAVFYFLETKVLTLSNGFALENHKLLDLFIKMFSEEGFAVSKLFGVIPMMTASNSVLGITASVMLYLIPVSMVVCIIAGIVAIFARKAAPTITRMILLIEFGTYTGYALSMLLPYAYCGMNIVETLDYAILGAAAFALVMFVVLAAVKSGKRAFVGLLIFLLTVASAGVVLYAICVENAAVKALIAENILYKWIMFGAICAYAVCVVLSFMGIAARKVLGADIIRCVVMLLMGAAIIVLSFLVETLSVFLIYGISIQVCLRIEAIASIQMGTGAESFS